MEESRECPVKKSSKAPQTFFQKSFPSPLSLGMRPLGLTRIDHGTTGPRLLPRFAVFAQRISAAMRAQLSISLRAVRMHGGCRDAEERADGFFTPALDQPGHNLAFALGQERVNAWR